MKKSLNLRHLLFVFFVLAVNVLSAQKQIVRGKVVFAGDKLPLAGVSVIEKGTQNGVITNLEGEFSINVQSSDPILAFTMIGMAKQEQKAVFNTVMNVIMLEDAIALEQVVVTGYTTEKKAEITGAVSVVKISDIASIPTGNVMSSLQGRLAGVNVSTDGQPGGTTTATTIRGLNTINDASPLYVIDGVQTRENISTLINPNDVESIQVLKDAASASIYGTQAANGVIIITTKKSAIKKTKILVDANLTTQNYHTAIPMMNATQWGEAYWMAYKNDGIAPSHDQYGNGEVPVIPAYIDADQTIPAGNTNWADEVYQKAQMQSYNLTVSNGNENSNSLLSFNYFDQDGLIKYTNFTRYNVRVNSDYRILDNKIKVGENFNISNWSEIVKPAGIEELTIAQHPLIPVYDINGGYAGPTSGLGDKPNPVRLLDQMKENRNQNWRVFGNIYLEIQPVKNLILKTNFGINYRDGFYSNFEPKWQEGQSRIVDKNSLTVRGEYRKEWVWSNTASYNFDFGLNHFNLFAGMEAKETIYEFLSGTREDYMIETLDYRYLSSGAGAQTNAGLLDRTAMVSYFGKMNYSYAEKYLFSATLRNDASSRFGASNNSAYFPALSAGWRISQENFMKDIELISDLKLRASYGMNGNDQMDNEATYTKYYFNLIQAGYDIAGLNQGTIQNGIIKQRSGNPDVRWEVTTQKNIGIDLAMFKNRFNVSTDFYIKDTKDMLIDKPYIAVIGEGGYFAYNGASMKNSGVEVVINWRDNITTDLSYEIALTGSLNKNEITDLPDEIYYTWGGGNGVDQTIVGQSFGSWFGYVADGLYRTEDEVNDGITQTGEGVGRIRYKDLNGDLVIDENDRTWLGSDQPKFVGGLNLSLKYKALDFSAFFTGMIRDAWNNSKFYTDFFQLWTGNHGTKLLDAFDPVTNPDSNIPMLTAINNNLENRVSTYFIEDGSYIKLKNIQLGVTLPKNALKIIGADNARIYVQAKDLLTLTNYTGADPEGLGYPYPIPRSYTIGFNLGF